MRHVAYIGLGSNLGDRAATLRRALELLHDPPMVAVESVSSFHETEPVDAPAGSGYYVNAAASLTTTLGPWALLARLMDVEHSLGRRRPDRLNAPRRLDLDLLLYDDVVLNDARLTLPHPRLHLRRFVLEPLVEIAPDARHPTLGETLHALVQRPDNVER